MATFDVTKDGDSLGTLGPHTDVYPVSGAAVRAVIMGRPSKTFVVADEPFDTTSKTIALRMVIFPLVRWVWIGAILLCAGAVVSLWPKRQKQEQEARVGEPAEADGADRLTEAARCRTNTTGRTARPTSRSRSRGCARRSAAARCSRASRSACRAAGFSSIFGPNGAGKTTTLRVLATLLTPGSGSIKVAGHDVREDPMPVRRAIGFISHNAMLYPDLTAEENLRFYADMYGVQDREARITGLLERLELSARRHDVVRTYSKGMRQRLAIARAILHRPRVLLLDEPHSGLDPRAVDILDGLLTEIRDEHTFVMVTHNIAKGLEWGTDPDDHRGRPHRLRARGRRGPRGVQRRLPRARQRRERGMNSLRSEAIDRGLAGAPVGGWTQFKAILRKDLIRELRTREHDRQHDPVRAAGDGDLPLRLHRQGRGEPAPTSRGGMLWVTFIFAMLLGLNRSFAQEKDEHCLDGLLLCPVDRVTIFFAKTAGNLCSC